jgi:O-antigen/teichoic acid export membrane protein
MPSIGIRCRQFLGHARSSLAQDGFSAAAVGSASVRAGAALLLFANTVALGRMIGADGLGTYAFVLALAGLVALPANFGLSTLALRQVAALREREQWQPLRGAVWFALVAVVLYTGLVIVAGGAALLLAGRSLDPVLLATMSIALALLVFHSAGEVIGAMLRALGRVVGGQVPDQIVRPALLLAMVLAAGLLLEDAWLTAPRTMAAAVIAAVAATILALVILARTLPGPARGCPARLPWRDGLRSWAPLALLGLMQGANSFADTLILGLLADSATVGIYRVAAQCALLVPFTLMMLGPVAGPYVAQLHAKGDTAAVQRVVGRTARAAFVAACPVFLLLVLFGGPVLRLVFGPEYEAGATALAILATGQLVNTSTGTVGIVLNMTGHERDTMLGVAVAAVATVVLNALLVPPLGIDGAALATAASMILWNVVMAYRLYVRTGLVSFALPLRRSAA